MKRKPLAEQESMPGSDSISSGLLNLTEGILSYSIDGKEVWSLQVEDLRLIGEHTTDHGPFVDDYFLMFVAGDPARVCTAPMYAGPSLFTELSAYMGADLVCGLAHRTDFASRVVWPVEMEGRPLLSHAPVRRGRGLLNRLMDRLFPLVSEEFTDDVNAHLGLGKA
jgi:hypothetical protein